MSLPPPLSVLGWSPLRPALVRFAAGRSQQTDVPEPDEQRQAGTGAGPRQDTQTHRGQQDG